MELLTYDEAAEFLGVRRGTLYAWVSLRHIPHSRLSARCVRFDKQELRTWVEARRVGQGTGGRTRRESS